MQAFVKLDLRLIAAPCELGPSVGMAGLECLDKVLADCGEKKQHIPMSRRVREKSAEGGESSRTNPFVCELLVHFPGKV